MHTHPRRNSNPKGGRLAKLAAIWGVIILVLGGFGAAGIAMVTRPPDAAAVCLRSAVPAVSTLVIVDTTDTLTEIQRRRVKAAIEMERDRLPRGGRLTMLRLNATSAWEPIEILSVCNPGTAAEANPLFTTTSQTDKRWAAAFADPIEAAISRANEGTASASSPIIQTVAAGLTRPDFDTRVAERRLVIVSDMLEHNKGVYSHLAGGDFWKGYRASPLARTVALDLHGVAVAVDYLLRPKYAAIQGARHQDFWRRLFTEAGAAGVSFIGLDAPGVPERARADGRIAKRIGRE